MTKRFQYDCVNCPDVEELEYIIDNERMIVYDTLKNNVDRDDLNRILIHLGYDNHFPITKDWHVSFHKSKTEKGNTVYYICHSCIEYIFY